MLEIYSKTYFNIVFTSSWYKIVDFFLLIEECDPLVKRFLSAGHFIQSIAKCFFFHVMIRPRRVPFFTVGIRKYLINVRISLFLVELLNAINRGPVFFTSDGRSVVFTYWRVVFSKSG